MHVDLTGLSDVYKQHCSGPLDQESEKQANSSPTNKSRNDAEQPADGKWFHQKAIDGDQLWGLQVDQGEASGFNIKCGGDGSRVFLVLKHAPELSPVSEA